MEAKKWMVTCLISVPWLAISQYADAASNGVFVGFGLGYDQIDTPNQSVFNAVNQSADAGDTLTINKDEHDIGGLGGVGYAGYNFTKYIGLEASYNYYAKSHYESNMTDVDDSASETKIVDTSIDFKAHSYNLVAKGYLPFENGFELFARGGAAYVIQKVEYKKATSGGGTQAFDVDVNNDELATPKLGTTTTKRLRPTLGIGAGYNFTKNIGAAFSWNHIFGSGNLKSDRDAIADLDQVVFELTYTIA